MSVKLAVQRQMEMVPPVFYAITGKALKRGISVVKCEIRLKDRMLILHWDYSIEKIYFSQQKKDCLQQL